MAHRSKDMRDLARAVLEEDLGLTVLEVGSAHSGHQYAVAEVDGVRRSFTFSLTPSKMPCRNGLRSDFQRRILRWRELQSK